MDRKMVYIVTMLLLVLFAGLPISELSANPGSELVLPENGDNQQRTEKPAFATEPITAATVGELYEYKARARGFPRPELSLSIAPEGMVLGENSAVITWTPTEAGEFEVEVIASNVFGSDTQKFTIEVSPAQTSPVITSEPALNGTVGQTYQYQIAANGYPEPSISLDHHPLGMSIDIESATLEWTPDAVGTYEVTILAENEAGFDAQQFSIVVDPAQVAPTVFSDPPLAGIAGIEYLYDVDASGYPAPAYVLLDAPEGMTINATSGEIAWLPDAAGTFNVVVKAENAKGSDSQAFEITIGSALAEPVITSVPVRDAFVDQVYSYILSATANPPATFSLVEGPPEMTLNLESGELSWTPLAEGEYNVVIEATNTQGSVAQDFTVQVSSALKAPVIGSLPVTQALVGLDYVYVVSASGNPSPVYVLAEAPAGMSIDEATGFITWSPEYPGTFDVAIEASNAIGSYVQRFSLHVGVQGSAPLIQLQQVTLVNGAALDLIAMANPNSSPTRVIFEYGIEDVTEFKISASPEILDGLANQQVIARLTDLEEGKTYQYRAVAENSIGRNESPVQTFTTYASSYQLGVERQFSGKVDSLGYRLFSIPGAIDLDVAETVQGVLEKDWGVFRDNGQPANYFEGYDGSEAFHFKPGRGFWILARANWTVPEQSVSTVPLDENGYFKLPLQPGWNIIASPFNEAIPWAMVRDASSSASATAKIWGFNGAYTETSMLEPYQAYYYFHDGPAGRTLAIPYPGLVRAAASSKVSKIAPVSDELASSVQSAHAQLLLEASAADTLRAIAEFLIHPSADAGKDPLDQLAPRIGFAGLGLTIAPEFESPYGALALDARASLEEGQVYTLVLNAPAGEPVSLRANGIDSFSDQMVYFVDGVTGEFKDLLGDRKVTIYPDQKSTTHHLVIGAPAFVDQQRSELVPAEFMLQQNYPNPFNSSTTLTYSLPQAGYVDLRIYNVLGQEVQQLASGEQAAGFHQLQWDGRSAQGMDLPAGLYFVRIRVDNVERVQSMTRVR